MAEPMSTPAGGAHRRIAISGPLTIYEAAPGKRALLEALGRVAELEIDLSGVTELDTAGLQLLLLVTREGSAAHKIVRLTAPSPAALDAIELCGLDDHLGVPVMTSSRQPRTGRSRTGTSESDG